MTRVLIVAGGLLLAVNVWIIAGISQRTNTEGTLPTSIEELIPKPGDLVSPQSSIGVNLRDDLTGILQLNGVEIPLDQLQIQPTVGIVTFAPGPGKDISRLPAGPNRVTVVFWPRASTREKSASSYSWSFKVGA
jgi:hypothetical protein